MSKSAEGLGILFLFLTFTSAVVFLFSTEEASSRGTVQPVSFQIPTEDSRAEEPFGLGGLYRPSFRLPPDLLTGLYLGGFAWIAVSITVKVFSHKGSRLGPRLRRRLVIAMLPVAPLAFLALQFYGVHSPYRSLEEPQIPSFQATSVIQEGPEPDLDSPTTRYLVQWVVTRRHRGVQIPLLVEEQIVHQGDDAISFQADDSPAGSYEVHAALTKVLLEPGVVIEARALGQESVFTNSFSLRTLSTLPLERTEKTVASRTGPIVNGDSCPTQRTGHLANRWLIPTAADPLASYMIVFPLGPKDRTVRQEGAAWWRHLRKSYQDKTQKLAPLFDFDLGPLAVKESHKGSFIQIGGVSWSGSPDLFNAIAGNDDRAGRSFGLVSLSPLFLLGIAVASLLRWRLRGVLLGSVLFCGLVIAADRMALDYHIGKLHGGDSNARFLAIRSVRETIFFRATASKALHALFLDTSREPIERLEALAALSHTTLLEERNRVFDALRKGTEDGDAHIRSVCARVLATLTVADHGQEQYNARP